uniref:carbohydrate sulfotransferase 11-like n=1 Tax=Myxine glutinosa TaxID=7769 RepID=UPI00358F66D4
MKKGNGLTASRLPDQVRVAIPIPEDPLARRVVAASCGAKGSSCLQHSRCALFFLILAPLFSDPRASIMRTSHVCTFIAVIGVSCLGLLVLYLQVVAKGPAIGQLWPRPMQQPSQDLSTSSDVRKSLQTHVAELRRTHGERLAVLQQACSAAGQSGPSNVLPVNTLRHLIVDDFHGLLYCYVPKVACTNWKRIFMVLSGRASSSNPLSIPAAQAHAPGSLRLLSDFPAHEAAWRLSSYIKFMFVREPFERLVSAYRNKFTRPYNRAFHQRYGTHIVRRYRANATASALRRGADVRFGEFVRYLLDPRTRRERELNEHWERAASLCSPCQIHYDVIGKYETLNDDAALILRHVGMNNVTRFPLRSVRTRTTHAMTAHFFENITATERLKLFDLYRIDFLMFNYSKPSFVNSVERAPHNVTSP